jgi:hypothetical protein
VGLASRGSRDMDSGLETILEEDVKAQIRKQARSVQLKSLAVAVAATAVGLLIG